MKDILDCRIEAVLEDIELTRLCDLPEDEAVSVEEFVSVTERTCQEAAQSLSRCKEFEIVNNDLDSRDCLPPTQTLLWLVTQSLVA